MDIIYCTRPLDLISVSNKNPIWWCTQLVGIQKRKKLLQYVTFGKVSRTNIWVTKGKYLQIKIFEIDIKMASQWCFVPVVTIFVAGWYHRIILVWSNANVKGTLFTNIIYMYDNNHPCGHTLENKNFHTCVPTGTKYHYILSYIIIF